MIRKRDFFLFVLVVLFLLTAIGFSVPNTSMPLLTTSGVVDESDTIIPESAEVITNAPDRQGRAKELRQKIAAAGAELSAMPESMVEDQAADEESPEHTDEGEIDNPVAASECEASPALAVNIPAGVTFVEREGARLLVMEPDAEVAHAVGSSTANEAETVEEVVAQLPMRRLPLSGSTCAGDGMVGFAQDGSVISNNEVSLYGVFGAETLVGYALDGFPIYGVNDAASVDECGGVVENGQYRYYLSSDRDTILECFKGIPVQL